MGKRTFQSSQKVAIKNETKRVKHCERGVGGEMDLSPTNQET